MGNPWTSTYDHPRAWYFNPLINAVTPSENNTVPIQWTAFPNRINHYFQQLFTQKFGSEATDKLHELADIGPEAFSAKYNINLAVPQNPCDDNDTKKKPFGPSGPRGWQDEYCEWSVTRLVNVQWPESSVQDKDNNSKVPLKEGGITPSNIANTTMETYAQKTQCMSCHKYGGVKVNGTSFPTDYSFVFTHAKKQTSFDPNGIDSLKSFLKMKKQSEN